MEWISYFKQQPIDGQSIFYYGEHIGVWKGRYTFSPNDPVSPHIMVCETCSIPELEGLSMMVDRMDAPWWMENKGQDKPTAPPNKTPDDYPS